MKHIFIISIAVLLLSSCSGCSNVESEAREYESEDAATEVTVGGGTDVYEYNDPTLEASGYNDGKAHVPPPPQTYMSEREAAFQDGEALAEEDRLNGTRSHVGMDCVDTSTRLIISDAVAGGSHRLVQGSSNRRAAAITANDNGVDYEDEFDDGYEE